MKTRSRPRTVLAEERDKGPVGTPDDVLDWRSGDFGKSLLLLDVVQYNSRSRAQDETGSAAVENLVGLDRWLDALYHRVGQVPDFDELIADRFKYAQMPGCQREQLT